MLATTNPPTAEQLHRAVRGRLGRAGLATVDRNLRKLLAERRAIALATAGPPAAVDGRLDPHDHFPCRTCGSPSDLVAPIAGEFSSRDLSRIVGGHRVEGLTARFRGICDACTSRGGAGD